MNNYPHRQYTLESKKSFFSRLSATNLIIFLNIIFFIAITILYIISPDLINYFALNSNYIFHGKYLWTLVLHMFSHILFLHLLVNMLALYSFGKLTESIIGKKRFLIFYLCAGLFAGILAVLASQLFGYGFLARIVGSPDISMIGASGAIFGVAALLMMLLPKLKFSILFIPFVSFPAYIILPVFLALFWAISALFNLPIGNVAHFGGFLAGVVYGAYLRKRYRKKVLMLQRMIR